MIIMVSEWVSCMDKKPSERSDTDLEIILGRLRHIRAFERLHPALLQQICYYGYYEDLDRGVTLFRQGDRGNNWYAVLTGSLDVQVLPAQTTQQQQQRPTSTTTSGPGPPNPRVPTQETKTKIIKPTNYAFQESVTLCTLGIGNAFGESVLESEPHQATVITNEHCELLRIEQRDFQHLWERNRHLMEDIISPLSHVRTSSTTNSNKTNNIPTTFVELSSAGLTSNGSLSVHRRSVAGLPGQSPQHKLHSLASTVGGTDPRSSQRRSASLTPSAVPPSVALLDKRIEMKKAAVQGPRAAQRLQQNPLKTPRIELQVEPSEHLARAGWVLRTLMLANNPQLIRDRKYHVKMFKRCMVGSEMVDWLLALGGGTGTNGNGARVRVHSRTQAIGMWQALLEEGVIIHVLGDHQFKDKYLFYRFRRDDVAIGGESTPPPLPVSPLVQSPSSSIVPTPTPEERQRAEFELQDILASLVQLAPDAVFRMILRKPPIDRVVEDLEIIYEELLHIKALSHLSNSVKRELAGVLVFESHPKAGTVLFNQGDEGKSWYIILRGSVDVVIYGKGVVCSLHDGDDFGKLALVNDAPRAATIVTRENGCQLLRVDKDDFNRILRDVEANTVRLKEHGQDVLLLQKIPTDNRVNATTLPQGNSPAHRAAHSHYKYMVMAGTPQKMLEHLLETRIDTRTDDVTDTFLEDFLMTHVIFMPSHQLCPELMKHYRIDASNCRQEIEFVIASKRRVVHFVRVWAHLIREAFFEDTIILNFLEELLTGVKEDSRRYSGYLGEELKVMTRIVDVARIKAAERDSAVPQKWKVSPSGQIIRLASVSSLDEDRSRPEHTAIRPIKATDEIVFRVHCADHTYTTIKTTVGATVEVVKRMAAEKLGLKGDLILVEVKSSGERFTCKDSEVSAPTGLTVNGRLFVTPVDHIDALTPLDEQEGPKEGSGSTLESLASQDIAYYMTRYEWDLFNAVHEYELIYQVFGRHQFRRIMANLDVFLRRFNEIQFWVVTEMCLATSLNRRVTLLKKFIKVAGLCRENQNMNSFFAIVMGLSNVAVSRLTQTWERLSGKLKRTFAEYETLIDPSRNHRRYRLAVAKMSPPIIPFMPLLLKDMTFSHEGNKTYLEGLVNFEKMHMIAQTLRTLSHCRSQPLEPPSNAPSSKTYQVKEYIRSLRVIDNQRRLTQLSHSIEPRR